MIEFRTPVFRFFEDRRRYIFPVHENCDSSLANRYTFSMGGAFWFDCKTRRIVCPEQNISLRSVLRANPNDQMKAILLEIDDRILQLSGPGGTPLSFDRKRDTAGRIVHEIGDIGVPFKFSTTASDKSYGVLRPLEERFQVLTNATGFANRDQQDRALTFIREAVGAIGNLDSAGPNGGNDIPGLVVFSDSFAERIKRGDLVDG